MEVRLIFMQVRRYAYAADVVTMSFSAQEIFHDDPSVFYVSLHAGGTTNHVNLSLYLLSVVPYRDWPVADFTGFSEERGKDMGSDLT